MAGVPSVVVDWVLELRDEREIVLANVVIVVLLDIMAQSAVLRLLLPEYSFGSL